MPLLGWAPRGSTGWPVRSCHSRLPNGEPASTRLERSLLQWSVCNALCFCVDVVVGRPRRQWNVWQVLRAPPRLTRSSTLRHTRTAHTTASQQSAEQLIPNRGHWRQGSGALAAALPEVCTGQLCAGSRYSAAPRASFPPAPLPARPCSQAPLHPAAAVTMRRRYVAAEALAGPVAGGAWEAVFLRGGESRVLLPRAKAGLRRVLSRQ